MPKQKKSPKQLERHFKGVANHRRVEILLLVAQQKGVSVEGISKELKVNFKTISEHARRLVQAGLLDKRYRGRKVEHTLSPYGEIFVRFIRSFSNL